MAAFNICVCHTYASTLFSQRTRPELPRRARRRGAMGATWHRAGGGDAGRGEDEEGTESTVLVSTSGAEIYGAMCADLAGKRPPAHEPASSWGKERPCSKTLLSRRTRGVRVLFPLPSLALFRLSRNLSGKAPIKRPPQLSFSGRWMYRTGWGGRGRAGLGGLILTRIVLCRVHLGMIHSPRGGGAGGDVPRCRRRVERQEGAARRMRIAHQATPSSFISFHPSPLSPPLCNHLIDAHASTIPLKDAFLSRRTLVSFFRHPRIPNEESVRRPLSARRIRRFLGRWVYRTMTGVEADARGDSGVAHAPNAGTATDGGGVHDRGASRGCASLIAAWEEEDRRKPWTWIYILAHVVPAQLEAMHVRGGGELEGGEGGANAPCGCLGTRHWVYAPAPPVAAFSCTQVDALVAIAGGYISGWLQGEVCVI
ncbi:hypothetical protein B0H13DRAFT_2275909 [Mycena leptocephala]|nr:hypothetical protein B0H13DRAFT_2275909 [Mycena leptocephala]